MIPRKPPRSMRPERWRKVEELYHAASEREPSQRAAFLEEACRGDDELRSEIESLLGQNVSLEGLLGWDGATISSNEALPGLKPGDELGPYKIAGAIGSGGMGEVYRARDTQLEREVAIKVLPRALANDPERLARFEREAKVLAALNHPNIAVIYGLAEAGGQRALVMELVPGETVADVIKKRKAMPFGAAAPIVRQLAEALEAAHEKGIVHRDVKPGNVMVTPAGLVKVLDFGLAAVTLDAPPAANDASDPSTAPIGRTLAGTILGTAAYISPEQASGLPVDKRSDIWSFGALLWEMLTGKRLFHVDKTLSQTLADVLHKEIDFAKLPEAVPTEIVELLRRCLDRDVTTRLRDIGEARVAIARCVAYPKGGSGAPKAEGHPAKLAWLLAAIGIVAAVVLGFVRFREPVPEALVVRAAILPPERTTFAFTTNYGPPALSPDGRQIVFAATGQDGKSQLWVRSLDSGTAQPLPGTEGGQLPFWSPDSRWVAFFADGKLRKINTEGGPPIPLAVTRGPRGGSWSAKGMIVFMPVGPSPLLKISSDGGAATVATARDPALGVNYRFPWFLPDGEHFLFLAQKSKGGSGGRMNLLVGSLSSTTAKKIGEGDSNAVYAGGRLLYLRGNTLVAQPFDPKALRTVGDAVEVAEQVDHFYDPASAGVFSAAAGRLAYQTGTNGDVYQLTWFDRRGNPLRTVGEPRAFGAIELSPDRKIVMASFPAQLPDAAVNYDLWTFGISPPSPSRFTVDPAGEFDPVWSPDGKSVVFNSERKGNLDLYRKPANNSGPEELLYADDQPKVPTSWSADGKFLLYHTISGLQGGHLWVLPMMPERPGAPRKPEPLLQSNFSEAFGQFSPDGRWVAYTSTESQVGEVYVAPFLHPTEKHQISPDGGAWPRWCQNGKEIFYQGRNGVLMVVEVQITGDSVEVGAVHTLFSGIPRGLNGYAYDISADGQHILAAAPFKNPKPPDPITLVENWAVGLKK